MEIGFSDRTGNRGAHYTASAASTNHGNALEQAAGASLR